MSIYRCSRCDTMKDNDYNPCTEDTTVHHGLMCTECACELPDTPEVRQGGEFSAAQLAVIKKLESEVSSDE